jgi:hypothetical protein
MITRLTSTSIRPRFSEIGIMGRSAKRLRLWHRWRYWSALFLRAGWAWHSSVTGRRGHFQAVA